MLERLARWSYKHRWRMLVIWIIALVGAIFLANVAGGDYASDFRLPGAESQAAFDLLQNRFPSRSGGTADLVFKADQGVKDPAVQQQMEALFTRIDALPHVDGVSDPYKVPAGAPPQISRSGTIAFAEIQYDVQAQDVPKAQVTRLEDLGKATDGPGLQIDFGGEVIQNAQFEPPGGAEAVGLVAAIIILLITFGSLLAMGLPILSALFGIGIGLSLVLLFANFISVPNFTPQIASMIGIGVGIDYALFIVTRYRQGLHDQLDPESASVLALTTSGRAVIFAGVIVVISLLGLLLMGFQFVQGIAIGGAAAVFVTMLASITLLPAVIGFVGRNIDRFHIPRLRRTESLSGRGFWYRWSRLIQRRPAMTGLIGLAAVVLLTVPLFSMRLGAADAGNDPENLTTRRAYDLLSEGFGRGFNGPFLLVAEIPGQSGLQALNRLSQTLQQTPGVAAVSPPIPNARANTAIITVYPTTSPQDAATSVLVHRLREQIVPQTMQGTGIKVLVGGLTPIFVDFAAKIAGRLPILIAVVIALSFILLMMVFRSILVPVKAAIMNLLSIGAAYGVMVAVFQWGWGKSIIGVGQKGPIESWVPMMMFTILFGLSMDYEIFLLSRVRESYLRSRDNAEAVANGVATTGRVITAAAAVMIAVFLSFVVGFDIRQIKEIGLGLAVAILVDATLIRMVLVPATMELLGDANWWFPRAMARWVPRIGVEREPGELEAELARIAEEERVTDQAGAPVPPPPRSDIR
jgi:RND superfamily putative drug exporter